MNPRDEMAVYGGDEDVGCIHLWERVAVVGRGTDYRCSVCGMFLYENPDTRRDVAYIDDGCMNKQGRTAADVRACGDGLALCILVAVSLAALVLGGSVLLGWWLS